MKKVLLLMSLLAAVFTTSSYSQNTKSVSLKSGIPVTLESLSEIHAADVNIGDEVQFKVSRSVEVDDVDAIPYGTIVRGKVYEAKKNSWFGTKGRLGIEINNIILPNGTNIPLSKKQIYIQGKNRTALSVVLFLVVVWPACFIHGDKAVMPAGYNTDVYTAERVTIPVEK